MVDQHRALLHSREQSPAGHDVADVVIDVQAHADDVAGSTKFRGAVVDDVRHAGQRVQGLDTPGPYVQFEACFGDGACHRCALVAEADEADFHLDWVGHGWSFRWYPRRSARRVVSSRRSASSVALSVPGWSTRS
jgi:hypothetical protein